jgi:hypothetical protein
MTEPKFKPGDQVCWIEVNSILHMDSVTQQEGKWTKVYSSIYGNRYIVTSELYINQHLPTLKFAESLLEDIAKCVDIDKLARIRAILDEQGEKE